MSINGLEENDMKKGQYNKITDVPGVTVGHVTIDTEQHKTGVTVVMPSNENVFNHKLTAACHVINGFGKTTGLTQIEELGTLESPIALTNTLNVGLVQDGLVEYMVEKCRSEDVVLKSFNPVVAECNDSYLNDIQVRAVKQSHVIEAIESASVDFAMGDVGCGKGTSCHQLKGGVGSASRIVELAGEDYTLGVLVQTNHGRLHDLVVDGKPLGQIIMGTKKYEAHRASMDEDISLDKGSIIIVLATDLPVSDRQLKRVCKRASVGLARLGSYIGHGSGEIVIGFTTAHQHNSEDVILEMRQLKEEKLENVFQAMVSAVEEAVLSSMLHADSVTGHDGKVRLALKEFL